MYASYPLCTLARQLPGGLLARYRAPSVRTSSFGLKLQQVSNDIHNTRLTAMKFVKWLTCVHETLVFEDNGLNDMVLLGSGLGLQWPVDFNHHSHR